MAAEHKQSANTTKSRTDKAWHEYIENSHTRVAEQVEKEAAFITSPPVAPPK
jgi:hypothetical protein